MMKLCQKAQTKSTEINLKATCQSKRIHGAAQFVKGSSFFLKKDCQIRKLHFQNLLGNDAKHIYYWFYFVKIHFWNVLAALTQSFM